MATPVRSAAAANESSGGDREKLCTLHSYWLCFFHTIRGYQGLFESFVMFSAPIETLFTTAPLFECENVSDTHTAGNNYNNIDYALYRLTQLW